MTLRVDGREYIRNATGHVRQLRGLLLQRQKTQDYIASEAFLKSPEASTVAGRYQLADGRSVIDVRVAPKGGQPQDVDIDATTWMIDRLSFEDVDGITTIDYYDYKSIGGALVALREVTSNGDHQYDVTQETLHVRVDKPIDGHVFDLPASTVAMLERPVTVSIKEAFGHIVVPVAIHGKRLNFLIDTGAQGVVIDAGVAQSLGIAPQGHLQVTGAQRSGGLGMAPLDVVQIGAATFPVSVVSVLDLGASATGLRDIDGILGFPFFASAEVRIDPDAMTMTMAKPGSLDRRGMALPVDTDRELVELPARVNDVDGQFVVDTGNSIELLMFRPFLDRHQGLVQLNAQRFAQSFGVGGSARALAATVTEFDFAGTRLFNRYANLMLTTSGAFADRFDAGNIGYGTLKNFVMTYDLANGTIYADRARSFDDGRFRNPNPDTIL